MDQPLKPKVTVKRRGDYPYVTEFSVGCQGFVVGTGPKEACQETSELFKRALRWCHDGYRWKVVIDRWRAGSGLKTFYRTRFIVKRTPFLLCLVEATPSDREPQRHCQFMGRMFKKAMRNAGLVYRSP